ncbi:MAG: hypothetical protein GY738_12790 [Pseudoalteromonas sp.]|nr:hypothetical protein [Pseudoalteromonas sp.]|tara:strand:- start:8837 stop:9607 length:771 start_codon:yes stop_codon:yes gene_type:complete
MQSDPFNHAPRTHSFDNNQSRQQQAYEGNYHQPNSNGYNGNNSAQQRRPRPQHQSSVNHNPAAHVENPQSQNEAQSRNHNEDNERDYTMFPVYSKRAALQFKLSETRKSQGRNFSFDTIMIEGANRINPNDPKDKRYNWNDKLSVQVMLTELPIVIAVFLGIAPSCQFMNHGQNKDKGFNFERQNDGLFASVFHKGGSMAVKLDWPTTLNIGHFMLAQYTANFEGLGSDVILRNINRMCQDMNNCNSFPLKKNTRQ